MRFKRFGCFSLWTLASMKRVPTTNLYLGKARAFDAGNPRMMMAAEKTGGMQAMRNPIWKVHVEVACAGKEGTKTVTIALFYLIMQMHYRRCDTYFKLASIVLSSPWQHPYGACLMHVAHPSHIENITFSLSCCPRRNQTCNLLELPEQEISLMKELPEQSCWWKTWRLLISFNTSTKTWTNGVCACVQSTSTYNFSIT